MRFFAMLIVIAFSSPVMAQVFRFGEPTGTAIYSLENHKPSPDRYRGVKPVVIIDKNEMTIIWGDSASAGGTEKVWKGSIINRTPTTVSAIVSETGALGSAVMLYTIDTKRGFLYMSAHKESEILGSSAASFVAVREK
ncbi:MAG: hypothetical protein H6P99_2440 [Holophagaceae bacterium]|nr:hypothetical protein [Holophagaceae bacterium]